MERERNVDPSGMYTPAPGGGQNKANEYQVISLGAGTAHRPSAEVCVCVCVCLSVSVCLSLSECVYPRNHHARTQHAHIHIRAHTHLFVRICKMKRCGTYCRWQSGLLPLLMTAMPR